MIIRCRECNTGLNVDESLLKESGSKIRCSICKHVFVVYPPVSTEEPEEPDKLIEVVPVPESEQEAQYVDIPKEDQDLKMPVADEILEETLITESEGLETPEASQAAGHVFTGIKRSVIDGMGKVNTELWIILSLLILTAAINYLVSAHRLVLGLYTLPTLFSAYFYGRRHAILTAFASVFMVGLLARFNPDLFAGIQKTQFLEGRWYDIIAWGSILVVTAYAMGTLNEYNKTRLHELRETYHGLLLILRQFVSKDKYTENHSYRVSIYATKIASYLGLRRERIEDVRAASLLHDIGKLDISRKLLYKAAILTKEEFTEMKKHVDKSGDILEPVGGQLSRIIPIILAHHDKFDGSGYRPASGEGIPIESRIISVADVYDSLTSDRPYRKAMSPFDAKDIIIKGSGKDFDPKVVKAFLAAFGKNEMEVPDVAL